MSPFVLNSVGPEGPRPQPCGWSWRCPPPLLSEGACHSRTGLVSCVTHSGSLMTTLYLFSLLAAQTSSDE